MDRRKAEKIYASGKEATILALLEMAARILTLQAQNDQLQQRLQQLETGASNNDSPSRPSGMIPVYEKPCATQREEKGPAARRGIPAPAAQPSARKMSPRPRNIVSTLVPTATTR